MKLATIRNDTRDGALAVVSRDLTHAVIVNDIAPNLQSALDDWQYHYPLLEECYQELNRQPGTKAFPFDPALCMAPLPRGFQFVDARAYLVHVERLRKAREESMPSDSRRNPLLHQGHSGTFIGPCDPVAIESDDQELDMGASLVAILDDVAQGTRHDKSGESVRLLALSNNLVLRGQRASEKSRGTGRYHSALATALSPVAATPDELGAAWDGRRVQRPVSIWMNDILLGDPDCGTDMQFDFPHLIAHAARSRSLGAGTILGTGTIANASRDRGHACVAELRANEVAEGKDPSPYLRDGDRIRIDMQDAARQSIFGAIDQIITCSIRQKKTGEAEIAVE